MRHSYDCHVRWSDVDAYGHVNNVKYFEYYQEARIAFLRELGGWADGDRESVVVARLTVDYQRPMVFRAEPYAIESWVTRVGTSSYDLRSDVRDGEHVLSRATTVMVGFDLETSRSRPLSDAERKALTAVVEAG